MSDIQRKKKLRWPHVLVICVLNVALLIGAAWAIYNTTQNVQNQLITKGSSSYLAEIFNPKDQWLPGETKTKEVKFGNRGEADQVIRFKVTEVWYDASNNVWTPAGTYTPDPAVINWTASLSSDWVDGGDGWYYYKKVLTAGTSAAPTNTPAVIDSVTFSDDISNAGPGAADDFSDKRYALTVTMETMDVNSQATGLEWGKTFTKAGSTITWS